MSYSQVKKTQHPELKAVRTSIYRCFEKVKCFMMPHPGMKVASRKIFEGNLAGELSHPVYKHI